MKFINNGGPVKIRIGEPDDCNWATIRKGESVDLPRHYGRALGFEELKITTGQIGSKNVETKQIEVPENKKQIQEPEFYSELCKIKGIGKKTAKDIITIFPVREELIKKIRSLTDNALPFRDDIEDKLRRKYG